MANAHMSTSFSMFLMDCGKFSGYGLGQLWTEHQNMHPDERAVLHHMMVERAFGYDVSMFHLFLAYKFPEEFTVWKARQRVLGCS